MRWVPDHMASSCHGCKMEFWLVRRKHHCRNCGHVFCGDCSGQMARIPSQNLIHAERVCLPCYKVLTGKNSPSRESMTESSATIGGRTSVVAQVKAGGRDASPSPPDAAAPREVPIDDAAIDAAGAFQPDHQFD